MKVKSPSFEIQEYTFSIVPKGAINKYKSKNELLDNYKDASENTFNEKLKLYDGVRKFPGQDTSMVIVRDQARCTLNLDVTTGNKVAELRVDPKKVPRINVIHLHKVIGDIIYTDLLHATL